MAYYLITFTRIGRSRPDPLLVDVPATADRQATADRIAERIYRYALDRMLSREIEVDADLDALTGDIFAGGRRAGDFTIEKTGS